MLRIFKISLILSLFQIYTFAQLKFEESEVLFNSMNIESFQNIKVGNGISPANYGERAEVITVPLEVLIEDVTPFLGFGIRLNLDKIPQEDIKLYLSTNDNINWSEWNEIQYDDDAFTTDTPVFASLSLLSAETKFVKIKIELQPGFRGSLEKVKYIFINPGESKNNVNQLYLEKLNSTEGTDEDFPRPPVISRTEWGCPDGQTSGWSPSYTTVTHMIVHHSAMSNTAPDWAAVVRSIWTMHTFSNGWGDVGYNYLIDPNGVVYEGRAGGDNAIGAHFCGTNGGTMGTCMMGTYSLGLPTSDALESLKKLLAWKSNRSGIDPADLSYHPSSGRVLRHISGHRSGCATQCPGTALYNHLPSFRSEVLTLLQSVAPQVSHINPNNGQSDFLAYKPVKINFSQAMDTATVRSALSIVPSANFSLHWDGVDYLEIRPFEFWAPSTNYILTVDTSAKNIFGQNIDGNGDGIPGDPFILSFSTAVPDNQAPTVDKAFPEGNGINVFAEMKIVFDEVLGENALIGRVKLLDESGSNVSYTGARIEAIDDKSNVFFRPLNVLQPAHNYTIKFTAGIFDMFGNETTSDILIHFRTRTGEFISGNIIDNFENVDQWEQPFNNPSSFGIDSAGTYFETSVERKRSGNFSGKFAYMFTGENGEAHISKSNGYLISDTSANYGVWIFGDLSGSELYFNFDNNNSYNKLITDIDWYGWEFISDASNNITAPNRTLTGFIIKQKNNSDKTGTVYFDDFQLSAITTSVKELEKMPSEFLLEQNYPNPFNPKTNIMFSIPVEQHVKLAVYDILGNQVELLISENFKPGTYSVVFDGSDLSSGVYFYSIQTEQFRSTRKMVILK